LRHIAPGYSRRSDMDVRDREALTLRTMLCVQLLISLLLCSLAFAGAPAPAPRQAVVSAGPTAHIDRVVYCTRHRHPHGCIKVPRGATTPRRPNQQGSSALTPHDVENGGGLGGGPGDHRATAIAWARTQRGTSSWASYCERFVEEAYGTRGQFDTAADAASALAVVGELRRGPITAAPPGSLVYFRPDTVNHGYGHVGLSLGRGRILSALATVSVTDVTTSRYWRNLYMGWAPAPGDWPGRIPPAPGPTTRDPLLSVRFTAPAPSSTVSGTVSLLVSAPNAGGVVIDAYYATDPRDPSTRGWHPLGTAVQSGDSWSLDWDTTTIPDQGFGAWGTVNLSAIALNSKHERTGTRDYRRVTVDNASGSVPPKPPDAPPPASSWPETTGVSTNTWTNYATAGGTQGGTIPAQSTVQIACKVQGFRAGDGNTWWYRIASAPWSNAYYASADAFYNDGQTSGSMLYTPLVDTNVPTC
jgi:hypothetical protein